MNPIIILHSGLATGTILLFAGIGEVFAERSGVLNLGVEGMMLLGAMAGFIGEALDIQPIINYQPARVGEVTHYVANIGKARALLDYTPQISLREGIFKTVAWNQEWVKNKQR